jgi:ribosomal protein L32
MAVPKKKTSYSKTLLNYNNWKNKKLNYYNFWVCQNCFSLNKPHFACNSCSISHPCWKKK